MGHHYEKISKIRISVNIERDGVGCAGDNPERHTPAFVLCRYQIVMSGSFDPHCPAVRAVVRAHAQDITYSDHYPGDDEYNYRHVILPKAYQKILPKRLMSESEWRSLGVQQSLGWEHYMIHAPEPHILLFRRRKDFDPQRALMELQKQRACAQLGSGVSLSSN